MKVSLLDCTLRDGGYVNNWNFGYENIRSITQKLINSNIDYIEIGFLDEREKVSLDRTIISDMETLNKIFEGIDKKNSKIVAMIDYGTFDIKKVLNKEDSFIEGIRVIFKKNSIKEALNYCDLLKEKGYYVSANAVMINKYSEEEFLNLINLANKSKIDTLTFVDTYGVLSTKEVKEHFNIMDKYLNTSIEIGFHSHNSLQLSYSNTVSLLDIDTNRGINIDGSLYGMGKSAGNACTELLVNHLNNNYNKHYDISIIMGLIDNYIMKEYQKKYWGYDKKYFLSASNKCHYNYVDYYKDKLGFDYELIDKILKTISIVDRFNYSSEKADEIYLKYKKNNKEKCIIFDIDGTLLDTAEGILNSIDYAVVKSDLPKLTTKKKLTFIGPPIHYSFKNAYNLTEVETVNIVNLFREIYKDNEMYNAKMYTDIDLLLKTLKEKNYRLAIATYKREDLTKDILKRFNLDKYFDVIKGSDKEGKLTKTEIVSRCLIDLKIKDKSSTIVVGDNYSDYDAAKNNNLEFIGVTYGFGFNSKDNNKNIELVDTTSKLKERILSKEEQ